MLGFYAVPILGAAMFPRLAYWARWPTRLGPRGRIAYTVFSALFLFASRELLRDLKQKGPQCEA